MSTAVGVLILDDAQNLSAPVRAVLKHMPEFHTITDADPSEVKAENTVTLMLLNEIRLADEVARIARLKEQQPDLRILVAFDALPADGLRILLKAGADAFAARSQPPLELCAVLLAFAEGSDCLVPVQASSEEAGDNIGLTRRETEVLRFLISGFSNKEAAHSLALSVRTVETHRLNLRRKTQTGQLKDLVSLARQLGLAPVIDGGKLPFSSNRRSRH